MIHKKIMLVMLMILSANAFSQNGKMSKENRDQIKSLKIAFITSELSLTSEEATKFWPIYNAFEDKQQDIRKQKMKGYIDRMDDASLDKLTEKEASTLLTQMESTEDELYQAKKKLISSLKGAIPPVKILKLKKAEEDFNRKLLQQYRDKRPRP
ncbi:sensor of ECF-type sigma factor [Flavobacterium sp. RSB2_4_14]|uniref:sensor of ECF-type sigma factor n=1 Tax=Flavobacterium sp. RSB2_4_14 TaxID=3447665 RepID=UPI003F4049F3